MHQNLLMLQATPPDARTAASSTAPAAAGTATGSLSQVPREHLQGFKQVYTQFADTVFGPGNLSQAAIDNMAASMVEAGHVYTYEAPATRAQQAQPSSDAGSGKGNDSSTGASEWQPACVMAFAPVTTDVCRIVMVWVSPSKRSQGLGTAAVKRLCSLLAQQYSTILIIQDESNPAAGKAYTKAGFKHAARLGMLKRSME
uniref:N-acetyltransferase domain-containing protein n=1 Tax=Chlamydomonas leiostraca TaxID=1034604 RepID=A0A7S0S548_9CHLO|mmetsp:Transcript_8065/g.20167  ORF Transcript_8065/g.20167 Transcript_8065/m.20167 type:complete len:200 (+) Transcript_8065:3-602(+)